jgi:molybdopterin synthase catalytic subunit
MVSTPPDAEWVAVTDGPLPLAEVFAWVVHPGCGAVVSFCGTVRDHSEGRPNVVSVEYEAYTEYVESRLADVAASARRLWPGIGRLALVHRVGKLEVGEVSVVVVLSAPHRAEAFEASRFCIDELKESVPIWKHETWAGGSGWAECGHREGSGPPDTVDVGGAAGGGHGS